MTPHSLSLLEDPPEDACALAMRLAHAEHALRAFGAGQIDAIVDPDGKTHLLQPAQEHLRQNERRLHSLIEDAADLITVLDRAGTVLSESGAVRRVLGYEPEELIGSNLFDRVHPEDLSRLHSAFFNVAEDFRAYAAVEFRHECCDEDYCTLDATVSSLRQGDVTHVVLICRDATQRIAAQAESKRREAVMMEASQAKDRFLAMLSHELRTPLTPVILGVNEMLEDERFADARPALAMVRRNVDLQLRLLDELLDFIRVGQHKVRVLIESIDVHDAVRSVLDICKTELLAARINVLIDFGASESIVQADPVRLQQVMWNLVKNAIKFSTPGSNISIASANDEPGELTLEFKDYGHGIDPRLLPLVFDPFEQGDVSIQRSNAGLGLGLFIARGLAEAQGGMLSAHSEGRGKGATFRLRLKLAKASAIEVHQPAVVAVATLPRSVPRD
jgi:two-component system, chemotaxis family, CheB/CheR fusion protein